MRRQKPRYLLACIFALGLVASCDDGDTRDQAQEYLHRSQIYLDQRQYRAAMIEVFNAIDSAPNDPTYKLALARIYNTLGAGRRASLLLENEDGPRTSLTLAKAYLLQRKFLSVRETLADFEPENKDHARRKAMLIADSYLVQGKPETAKATYLNLLDSYPDDKDVRHGLAESYLRLNETHTARELVDRLLAENPDDPETLYLDARVALKNGNPDRAENRLSNALAQFPPADLMLPERAKVLELLAQTMVSLGRGTEALVYQRMMANEAPDRVLVQQGLKEALAALEEGSLDVAKNKLDALLSAEPTSQSAAVLMGMVNLYSGDMDAAEPLLSQNVDVETAHTETIRATALAQAHTGKTEQAFKTLDRAIQAHPEEPILYAVQGLLGLGLPQHQQKGYLNLKHSLALNPHQGRLRLALARYHHERGEPGAAFAQLGAAFRHKPDDWPVTNTYLGYLLSKERWNDASDAIAELKTTAPKAPETTVLEARYLYQAVEQTEGLQLLERMAKQRPDFAPALAVLAQMHADMGQHEKALNSVEQLLALTPRNERALVAGVKLLQSDELEGAPNEWLQRMARTYPASGPNTWALRAMLLRKRGQVEDAVRLLDSYEGETSDYFHRSRALIYRDQARVFSKNGEPERAISLLNQALARFPDSLSLNMDLLRLRIRTGRLSEAKRLAETLREQHPTAPILTLAETELLVREKKRLEAYQHIRKAWEQTPDNVLAPLLISLADQQDAEAVPGLLAEWQALAPNSRARLLYMAERHRDAGNDTTAEQLYERLLEQQGNDAIVLNNLAWLLKDRDSGRALSLAKRAVDLKPTSAAMLDTYGWILHLQGDSEHAVQYLQRAAELAPDVPQIQANLSTVQKSL